MSRSYTTKYKRIAAGIAGMLMLLIMLFSAFYIVSEADHDCTGEDCPVCACIRECENTLRQPGDGSEAHLAATVPVFFLFVSALLSESDPASETPVSRKVRLNN